VVIKKINYIMKVKLSESEKNRILSLYEGRYVKNIINEAYYGIIQEQDDICEIICKRKMAQHGSNGDVVRMIQHLLMANGYNPKYQGGGMNQGCSTNYKKCDGLFRNHTKDTVKEFQRAYGLTVDGKVGYQTWKKMCEVIKFTSSVTKNMFCKNCNCNYQDDDERDDDERDDDKRDDDFLDQFDCEDIKNCMQKYLFAKPVPDYVGFMECINFNAKHYGGDYIYMDGNVRQCYWNVGGKDVFKCPKFVNCMPGPGQDFKYCGSIAIKACIRVGCTTKAV